MHGNLKFIEIEIINLCCNLSHLIVAQPLGICLVVMGRRDKEVVLISEDLESSKGSSGPLHAPPKVQEIFLSKEDEFLILAWNDYNICRPHLFTHARKELMVNNDPGRCAREIVRKALYWEWGTNMKDGVVCFSPNPLPPCLRFRTHNLKTQNLKTM
ncbi:hypothetical protein ACFX14_035189 [Malus domestica]